jgi:hypothetical protein
MTNALHVLSLACKMIRFPQVFCLEYAGIEARHCNRIIYNAVVFYLRFKAVSNNKAIVTDSFKPTTFLSL